MSWRPGVGSGSTSGRGVCPYRQIPGPAAGRSVRSQATKEAPSGGAAPGGAPTGRGGTASGAAGGRGGGADRRGGPAAPPPSRGGGADGSGGVAGVGGAAGGGTEGGHPGASGGGGPWVPRVSCLPSLSIRPAPWPAGPSVPGANLLPRRPVAPYCARDLRKHPGRGAAYGACAGRCAAERTGRRGARRGDAERPPPPTARRVRPALLAGSPPATVLGGQRHVRTSPDRSMPPPGAHP